jgi:hypothetical protein
VILTGAFWNAGDMVKGFAQAVVNKLVILKMQPFL